MILQPFVENSIEHGFTGIDYPGDITVTFLREAKDLHIAISDNGKGLIVYDKTISIYPVPARSSVTGFTC